MAQRLRENAQKINWTPEPIRPELLHFFDLPSISSVAQHYRNLDFAPSTVHSEAIPSSPERMPIRTPQPPLEKKNPSEMVLTYHRSRNAPACKLADPPPSSGARNLASQMASEKRKWKEGEWKGKITISPSQLPPQGNDLKSSREDLDPSVTEIGSPPPLSLSQKGARSKRLVTLLFPDKIPKLAKRRRIPHARSTQIGWINTGGIIPWAMAGSHIPYNLRRRKHFYEADAPMAVAGSFKSAPLVQPGNGKRKLSVCLLSNEIEEDFMKMKGEIPLQKPNKRPKNTQSQLDNLFPGMCFIESDKNVVCNPA